jgi:hypothetical protein
MTCYIQKEPCPTPALLEPPPLALLEPFDLRFDKGPLLEKIEPPSLRLWKSKSLSGEHRQSYKMKQLYLLLSKHRIPDRSPKKEHNKDLRQPTTESYQPFESPKGHAIHKRTQKPTFEFTCIYNIYRIFILPFYP